MVENNGNKNAKTLILIVDDISRNIHVLGSMLKEKDYRISAATSGKQALEILEGLKPDIILLDIMMPEMDGFEVCQKIKANPEAKDIPVIFLTALTDMENILKGFAVGGIDYVTKPFHSEELLARVNTHLELKRARDREKELIASLQDALAKIKQLSGMLPICSHCKKIRDAKGDWQPLEDYLEEHSNTKLSHGLCPDCVRELYPQLADKILDKIQK